MDILQSINLGIYWTLIILWGLIVVFYIRHFQDHHDFNRPLDVLLLVLAIDALRTFVESAFFGVRSTAQAGFLPQEVFEALSPQYIVFIPKIFNVLVAVLIFSLLLRRLVPSLTEDKERQQEQVNFLNNEVEERKRIAEELLRTKQEAEMANEAKSQFLASMSHELRTPLNAILGFSQMLKIHPKEQLSKAQTEYVDSIISGGEHLLELVNDVLDLVKIEADQIVLSMEHMYSNEVIDESIALITPAADARHITIINRVEINPPTRIRADALRLKQGLINLLSNAIKYNVDNGKVILDSQETEDGYLHISITDTGIGIAKNHHADVFQIFHRLDADSMKATEGTGIGLAVTKQLVERMGGRIGFETEEDKGSTFWIEMPLTSTHGELVWQDSLSVGVDEIDEDHKKLIAFIDKLSDHVVAKGDVDQVMADLIDYTFYHFQREEAVMEICDYPDLEEHRAMHRQLAATANQLAERWRDSREPEVADELLEFLRAWLVEHIMQEDAAIGPLAKGKEVEIARALTDIGVKMSALGQKQT